MLSPLKELPVTLSRLITAALVILSISVGAASADEVTRETLLERPVRVGAFELAPDAVGTGDRRDKAVLEAARTRAADDAAERATEAMKRELRARGITVTEGGSDAGVSIEGTIRELQLGRWGKKSMSREAAVTLEVRATSGRTTRTLTSRATSSKWMGQGDPAELLLQLVDRSASDVADALAGPRRMPRHETGPRVR
jgi:hypothetical protein